VTAATKDLLIKQGDSYTLFFRVRSQIYDTASAKFIPGEYRNLTGLVGKAQIRVSAVSDQVLAEFAVSIPDQTIVENRGSVLARLTPAQTALLPASPSYPTTSLVWDLDLSDNAAIASATWRKTYLEGGVAVKAQVTR